MGLERSWKRFDILPLLTGLSYAVEQLGTLYTLCTLDPLDALHSLGWLALPQPIQSAWQPG